MQAKDKYTGLTAERVRELLEYNPETGIFIRRIAKGRMAKGSVAGCKATNGYVCIKADGECYKAHRLAWLVTHGTWPTNLIDHINGDKADNRIDNLREATESTNKQNMLGARSDSKTGLLGVSFHKKRKKFMAIINVDGKNIHIGCYPTAKDAYHAYVSAKRQWHAGNTL